MKKCTPLVVLLSPSSRRSSAPRIHLEPNRQHARCHILTNGLDLEILGELAPGAFHYGMTCLVEFEPHSLWYEMSLTIAAGAVKNGIKTEYHVFQHTPADVRAEFTRMGVDIERHERRGVFRIMDSYTPTTPFEPVVGGIEALISGRNPKLEEWNAAIKEKIRHGFDESEKRWLHIDDNEAILLQYNEEEYVTNGWRTVFLPMAKTRQLLTLHALLTGIASDSFYRKREALADAVVDLKAIEEENRIEHYIRLRALRGTKFDSRWRRLEIFGTGLVRLSTSHQVFDFENKMAERVFDCLLKSFVDDHFVRKYPEESSGWRSAVEIAKDIGVRSTILYSRKSSATIGELVRKGFVQRKVVSGQRGRGGKVTRLRVAYDRGFVKEYIERYVHE